MKKVLALAVATILAFGLCAIDAGFAHTVGLTADGNVVAVGRQEYGICDVTGW